MCCVANCIGDLDMQLASKPQLSASGMHGQKKEFSNKDFTKKGRYHFVATSTFKKMVVSGQSMGPDMTCTVCLTRVIAVGRSRGL